jgi:hypothetical protein
VDLVIRHARVAGVDRPVDIGVRGERIARIVSSSRPRSGSWAWAQPTPPVMPVFGGR